MKPFLFLALSIAIVFTVACNTDKKPTNKAETIINNSIAKHGGTIFDNSNIVFTFRNRKYDYKNENGKYEYSREWTDTVGLIKDILTNDAKYRTIDGETVEVADTQMQKYANSVNSVMYFAFLPYKLNDAAVTKEYIGTKAIKGKNYDKIKVTFAEEGGGKDFQDIFVYWINQATKEIDYLAYSYETDDSGYRFRAAYNKRNISGVLIQDYVNYKPLAEKADVLALDDDFLNGKLKELSKIELENVVVLTVEG